MQAIESTLEMHAPEVDKIATKRRINPCFEHAVHQLKSKTKATKTKWLRNKTQENKEK